MIRRTDDGRGGAVRKGDDGHALVTRQMHGLDDFGAVGLAGDGDQHVAPVGPCQIVDRGRSGPGDGVEINHPGRGEVGKVARIGVVHAHAQRKHPPRTPDRLGRCGQLILGDARKGFFDIAQGAVDHVGIKPAKRTGTCHVLQPTGTVGKADLPRADCFAERRAEIVIAVETGSAGHAHHRVGRDLRGLRNLAHGADPNISRVLQHICGRLARLR